jgi:hypothetical protein
MGEEWCPSYAKRISSSRFVTESFSKMDVMREPLGDLLVLESCDPRSTISASRRREALGHGCSIVHESRANTPADGNVEFATSA